MTYSLYQMALLFLIYSFLGWCTEVCYAAVTSGKVVNRGFLNGPLCPIYGVGMLGVLVLLAPVSEHLVLLFLGGMLLCTAVELVGGWLLEKVFDTRWWDYSSQPFNLGGYVCLGFSILWGLAVTFVVRLIHPVILTMVDLLPRTLGMVLICVLYVLFVTDLVMTLVTIAGIKRRMRELERVAEALHSVGDSISDRLGTTALAADAKLDELKETGQEKVAEGREKVSAAVSAQQEKMAEGRERVTAMVSAGQERVSEGRQKLEERVSLTLEELQNRRRELEARQKALAAESRRSFGARRLARAFPDARKSIQERMKGIMRR